MTKARRKSPTTARRKKARKSPVNKITKARQEAFKAALARTGNATLAARQAEVSRRQAYEWRQDPAFRLAWEEALDEAAELMEGEAWRRAIQGVEKPYFHGGEQVGVIREYSDTLLIFLLKAARPHKFRDRVELTLKDPLEALAEATGLPEHEIITAVREINEQKLLPAKASR